MTPDYIRLLANIADPGELWKLPGLDQLNLPAKQRCQLDAGVALRRYASNIERLNALIGTGNSLLITPLSEISSASKTVPTPDDHKKWMKP